MPVSLIGLRWEPEERKDRSCVHPQRVTTVLQVAPKARLPQIPF